MKAKLLSATLVAVLLTGTIYAQTKPTFGIRAGINFQNLNGKDNSGDKLNNDLKTGFNIGANAEIPVGVDFYLQPGLLFTTKGTKFDISQVKTTWNISYLELPVNFIYKPELGDGKVLLGFGPYAAFALGGKTKVGNVETDINFGSSDDDELKSFDAGANLLAGYEFSNKFSFQLNAGLGLVNIYNRPTNNSKATLKNTGFGVSVGYRFK